MLDIISFRCQNLSTQTKQRELQQVWTASVYFAP